MRTALGYLLTALALSLIPLYFVWLVWSHTPATP